MLIYLGIIIPKGNLEIYLHRENILFYFTINANLPGRELCEHHEYNIKNEATGIYEMLIIIGLTLKSSCKYRVLDYCESKMEQIIQ